MVCVIRYGSDFSSKNLTPAEHHSYQSAGIADALVWENTTTDYQGGPNAGAAFGTRAKVHADSLSWPADRPYRAAFDMDVPSSDYPLALAYLRAFAAASGRPGGGYGPWPLLSYFEKEGGFGFGWGVGSSSFNTGARPASVVLQQRPGVHPFSGPWQTVIGGVTCDLNDALALDFGQNPGPIITKPSPPPPVEPKESEMLVANQPDAEGKPTPGWWLLTPSFTKKAIASGGDLAAYQAVYKTVNLSAAELATYTALS